MSEATPQAVGVAIVTGAAGGIGLGIVSAFEAAGWQVLGLDIAPGDGHRELDLTDDAAIDAFADQLDARGSQHVLVNNAARQIVGSPAETTLEGFRGVLDANLTAPFALTRALLPWFKSARHAAVVNVASVHAIATSPGIAAYAASKGGLQALTRALSLDLAPHVRVNAVLPGAVDTPMLRDGLERDRPADRSPEEHLATFGEQHPVGRVGQPADIAQAVLYLADHQLSAFVTGSSLVVDGGATARLSTE